MSASALPAETREINCLCGAYLGTIGLDGSYMRFPPCRQCGWQWVGEAVGKRARQSIMVAGERLEVKAR
jgi:hypothetical protein